MKPDHNPFNCAIPAGYVSRTTGLILERHQLIPAIIHGAGGFPVLCVGFAHPEHPTDPVIIFQPIGLN